MKKSPKWFTDRVVEIVKRPDLHQPWGKSWGGTLLHFWVSDRETLCGKELTRQQSHWYYRAAKATCTVCKGRAMHARDLIEGRRAE